ncbi:MAG: OmpA family protein [Polyangiaceae bacterium]
MKIASTITALLLVSAFAVGCGSAPSPMYVGFDSGQDLPKKGEDEEVKKAAAKLKEDPELHLVVIGRADSTGDEQMNKELSLRRARRVQAALLAEGIAEARLEVAARGESDPTTDDDSADGLAENRRTELFFFYPKDGSAQSQLKFNISVEAKADAKAEAGK